MNARIPVLCRFFTFVAATTIWSSTQAQDSFNQEWLLDPTNSSVYMQTLKDNSIFEVQQFRGVEGNVSSSGDANVRIDLASIDSGIDIRDTRLRFQLFETFRFRYAQIGAKLDKAKLKALTTQVRVRVPLALSVSMHGRANELETEVWVTRVSETAVSVATVKPIIVTAESFGLDGNIAKLVDAIGGTSIAPGATITFDMMFGTGALKTSLEAARSDREKKSAESAAAAMTAEECDNRFMVLSQTGAIRFKTGGAVIDPGSEVVLGSVVDIANRCGALKFDIHGHSDNVGEPANNLKLSQDRAKAVSDYLLMKGVSAARMRSEGFGEARPIKSNDTEAGRVENRRIEFKLRKE